MEVYNLNLQFVNTQDLTGNENDFDIHNIKKSVFVEIIRYKC